MKRPASLRLSSRYEVRALTEAELPEIYALCQSNPLYYECCGVETSEALIRRDMTLLPPGAAPDQKYYVGFFDAGRLLAVLDLIDGYPEEDVAFIGFFMVHGQASGRGLGTEIIRELCEGLRAADFRRVRLAYEKSNPQSGRFWAKNGFLPLREVSHPEFGTVILAERAI